jgi:hypothetical protein
VAALRATQFFLGTIVGSTVQTVYTVPTGHRIILHSFQAMELSNLATTVQLREATIGTFMQFNLGALASAEQAVRIVFGPGQVLQVKRSNAGSMNYILSGTYLFI